MLATSGVSMGEIIAVGLIGLLIIAAIQQSVALRATIDRSGGFGDEWRDVAYRN